jgi:hypothetical protein
MIKSRFTHPLQPQKLGIEPNGSYTMKFGLSPDSLSQVRQHQHDIQVNHPGWMTTLTAGQGSLHLKVHPVSELPHMFFNRNRYTP